MLLNVITACIRPLNLSTILKSFVTSNKLKIPIHWYIISNKVNLNIATLQFPVEVTPHFLSYDGPFGIINPGLDAIQEGMVCIIDDDNIMHPEFICDIFEVIQKYGDNIGILYHQNLGKEKDSINPRNRMANYNLIGPQQIDTAQFTVNKNLIGDIRWPAPQPMQKYCPDGVFIQNIYKKHPNKFIIIDKILCYYNYLTFCHKLDFS